MNDWLYSAQLADSIYHELESKAAEKLKEFHSLFESTSDQLASLKVGPIEGLSFYVEFLGVKTAIDVSVEIHTPNLRSGRIKFHCSIIEEKDDLLKLTDFYECTIDELGNYLNMDQSGMVSQAQYFFFKYTTTLLDRNPTKKTEFPQNEQI